MKLKEYLFKLQQVVNTLDSKEIGVVAIKGYGKDDKEAKMPLNFNIEKKYGSWEEFTTKIHLHNMDTLNLIKIGKARGIGVIGYPYFYILDIDLYKVKDEELKNKIKTEIIDYFTELTYVERTAKGGYHIFFRAGNYLPSGVKGYVDIKFKGYVITAPTRLFIKKDQGYEILKYDSIGAYSIEELDLVNIKVEEYKDILRDLIQTVRVSNFESEIPYPTPSERGFRWYIAPKVKEFFSKISDPQFAKYFLYVYASSVLRCPGFAEALRIWLTTKKIPIPRFEAEGTLMKIPRGTHFLAENDIFGILHFLGFPPETIVKLSEEIDYIDGVEGSKPVHTYLYTIRKNQYVVPNGYCPFMLLGKCSCLSTVLRKARRADRNGWKAYRIAKLLLKTWKSSSQ